MWCRVLLFAAAVSAATVWSERAQATILTFDIFDPQYNLTEDYPEGFLVAQEYGDRVTSLSSMSGTATFEYGLGAEGFTPNVTAEYGPFSIFTGGPSLWRYDYGDLQRVLFQGSEYPDPNNPLGFDYDVLDIVLRADPGYEIELFGFDLGGWNQTDYVIDEVGVYTGTPSPVSQIFAESNVTVHGDAIGPPHTTFSFGAPLRSDTIWVRLDATNLGDASVNIGIDNIRFGQVQAASVVPEPTSLALLSLGACGLAVGVVRREKKRRFLLAKEEARC